MQELQKYYALIKLYFKIPYPERLSDDELSDNISQLDWLGEKGLLGVKIKSNGR